MNEAICYADEISFWVGTAD